MKRPIATRLPILVLSLALAGLGACKSVKSSLTATPTAALGQRLPPLQLAADPGPLVMNDGALPEDPLRLFRAELQRNVMEPTDTATYGYARLVITKVHTSRTGRILQAIQVFPLMMTPTLLGVPLEWYHTEMQAEVQVLDASGEIIGTYTGQGTSKVKVAAYHGYSQKDAPRLADVLALRQALSQIRPQLDTASIRLRSRLLAGGAVDNPAVSSAH